MFLTNSAREKPLLNGLSLKSENLFEKLKPNHPQFKEFFLETVWCVGGIKLLGESRPPQGKKFKPNNAQVVRKNSNNGGGEVFQKKFDGVGRI